MVCSLVVLDIVWFPFCASEARYRERKISSLSVALTLTGLSSETRPGLLVFGWQHLCGTLR